MPAPPVLVPRAPAGGVLTLDDPLFVSDLHLSAAQPRTQARFLRFLREEAAQHAELLILGDLFEYWVGDDVADDATELVAALRALAARGVRVYLMHGNRDLLLGAGFAEASSAQLLPDPTLARCQGRRLLLAHGDAWCTADLDYMRVRPRLRWAWAQRWFLRVPAGWRRRWIARARAASETRKQGRPVGIMDVTEAAVAQALSDAGAEFAIHGHTHRPATHRMTIDGRTAERWVLPDWDYDREPVRGGYLRFVDGAPQRVDLPA
jgi:UDP-2,3-diacylglucosamine hydrolase